MNATRTLTSMIAAATIVGTVGFAYAQTVVDPAAPATMPTTQAAPAPMAPAQDTVTAPATSPAPTDSGMVTSEPAPKADRN